MRKLSSAKQALKSIKSFFKEWAEKPEWLTMPIASLAVLGLVHAFAWAAPSAMDKTRDALYPGLQKLLQLEGANQKNEPVIVNINGMPPGQVEWPNQTGKTYSVTNRNGLDALVKAIASAKADAIGIDVDMSGVPADYIKTHPQDQSQIPIGPAIDPLDDGTLLPQWQALKSCPVFVGVYRSLQVSYDPQSGFLGSPDLDSMAASLFVPNSSLERSQLVIKMLDNVKVDHGNTNVVDPKSIKSLGYAVATAHQNDLGRDNWFGEVHDKNFGPSVAKATARTIDYSAIDSMKRIPWSDLVKANPDGTFSPLNAGIEKWASSVANRPVFLGNLYVGRALDTADDSFDAPGHGVEPGVLLHASTAYSVANFLIEISPIGMLVIDGAFILVEILLFFGLHELVKHWKGKKWQPTKMLTYDAVAGFMVVSCMVVFLLIVSWTRYVADDLAILLLGIATDWGVHHFVHRKKRASKKEAAVVAAPELIKEEA